MSSTATPTKSRFPLRRKGRQVAPGVHIRPDGSRDVELPLREHLIELRNRLIKAVLAILITTGISFAFAEQEVAFLVRLAEPYELIAIEPTEAFISYLKVAFYTGIAVSMPLLVYQLFRFLAPGLTRNEKRAILISLPGITLFFLMGVVFCYLVVLPSATDFLLGFGSENVTSNWRISSFLSFVTRFLLAMGIAFETPIIIFMLSRLGIATPRRLRRFRRPAYLLAFVIAAIITPTPDPLNQSIVAVTIIILF